MNDDIANQKERVIKNSLRTPEDAQGRNYLKMADLVSDQISSELSGLTSAIEEYNRSSGKVARALNWLTAMLVVTGVLQLILQFYKRK